MSSARTMLTILTICTIWRGLVICTGEPSPSIAPGLLFPPPAYTYPYSPKTDPLDPRWSVPPVSRDPVQCRPTVEGGVVCQ